MTGWEHPSIADLLAQLFAFDESERIEVKAGSSIGKAALETVIAFANEPHLGGGYLILGVEEDAASPRRYRVVGVENPDKLKNDLSSQCRSTLNEAVNIRSQTEQVEGKAVLAFYVAEADPNLKPIYKTATGLPKGAFRRGPSGDYRCTDQDISLLFRQKEATEYDSTAPVDAGMDDLDPEAVEMYRAERAKANPNAEELRWSDPELLRSLGCAKRIDGVLKPTVAGILLFGQRSALRRLLPAVRVDYIRVAGKEWVEDPNTRFDSVEMRDTIFRLIHRSIAAIVDDLPKSFNLPQGKLAREDRPILPINVVREAVVNALMHRNYQKHQPVQIIRYSNRLEVRNPGHSLKPVEQLGDPGSVSRNPTIAAVLHETHLAETKGSGIRVMRALMQDAGLESPQFESDRHGDQFRSTYLFHHFLGEEDLEWLGRFRALPLADDHRKALVYARETGSVSNSDYRSLNRVDTLTASQQLCHLRDLGVLESKERGRATYYVLSDAFQTRPMQGNLFDLIEKLSTPEQAEHAKLSAKPDELEEKPDKLATKPDKQEAEPAWQVDREAILEGLRKTFFERLGIPADKPPRGDDVKRIVRYLCAERPYTAQQLGNALEKNPQYLKQAYLAPMLKSGELELLHPDKPKHPKQAYRATVSEGGEDS